MKKLSIMEVFQGGILTHSFYVSTIKDSEADILQTSNVLYLYGNPRGFRKSISKARTQTLLENKTSFFAWMSKITYMLTYNELNSFLFSVQLESWSSPKVGFTFNITDLNTFIVDRLLYSNKGVILRNLLSKYRKMSNSSISNKEINRLAADFYYSVKDTGMFLLKKHYVGLFPKTAFQNYYQIVSS